MPEQHSVVTQQTEPRFASAGAACCVPQTPATFTISLPWSASGGKLQAPAQAVHICGSANCVVCTPTATPPAPAATVVASQSALAALIQLARCVQREWMRRNHQPAQQFFTNCHQNLPSRV